MNGEPKTIDTLFTENAGKPKDVKALEPGRSFVLNNILYDWDKATLRAESTKELDNLVQILKENKITFNEIEVYETNLTPKKTTAKFDGILFFSPSAVESYLKLNTIKDEFCFCIGETTAESLQNKKIKNIVVAEKPTIESVIELTISNKT